MLQNNPKNVHSLVKKVEKMALAFWSASKLMFIFSGTKNYLYTSQTLFLDTLYISFSQNRNFLISLSVVLDSLWVTDIGKMCHYSGRIRILCPMLGGAVTPCNYLYIFYHQEGIMDALQYCYLLPILFFRIPCTYNEQVLQHVIFLSN